MEQKNLKKFSCFLDNCICTCCSKISQLQSEDLLSAVNVLKNSRKISHITKRDIFKLHFTHTLHETKNFCLTKICEENRKDHFFISFRMFPFYGNIFSELFFERKCKKAASFRKCVFLHKYEIFVYDSCA